jgi:hypothetical protein
VSIDIGLAKFLSFVQMSSKAIKYFYKNVIESLSDEESNGENGLLFAAASMAHWSNLAIASADRMGRSLRTLAWQARKPTKTCLPADPNR